MLHHGCKCEIGCEKSRVIREAERASELDCFHLHHAIPYAILVLRRFHNDVSTDVVKLVGQDARIPSTSLWYYTETRTQSTGYYTADQTSLRIHPSLENHLHPHQDIHSCVVWKLNTRLLGFNQCFGWI